MAVIELFRSRLANIELLNQDLANDISRFASNNHTFAAQEIATVVKDFIRDVRAITKIPSPFALKLNSNYLCRTLIVSWYTFS